MPFVVLLIGITLIVTGFKGTAAQLTTRVRNDLTGAGAPGGHGFLTWAAAIGVIGGLGFVPEIQKPSRLLIALIIVVMLLKSDTGVIAQFFSAIGTAEQAGGTPGETLAQQAANVVGQNASGTGGDQIFQANGQGALAVSNASVGGQQIQAALNGGPTTGGGTSASAGGGGISVAAGGAGKAGSAITGALGGAAAGAMVGGPIGAAAGGVLGLIGGLL